MQSIDILIHGLTSSPLLWTALIFVLGLLVGSFLNVVIHRVPIMLEREWTAQAREILAQTDAPTLPSPASGGGEETEGSG